MVASLQCFACLHALTYMQMGRPSTNSLLNMSDVPTHLCMLTVGYKLKDGICLNAMPSACPLSLQNIQIYIVAFAADTFQRVTSKAPDLAESSTAYVKKIS